MNADNIPLGELTDLDQATLDKLAARQDAMLARTIAWSKINTGSYNAEGLKTFAPMLAEAFAETDAVVELLETQPIESVKADTVFPKGTFTEVTDLGGGKFNGPGLTDMKGGICVMLEAIKAFEAGPLKDQLGYKVILTPDEEIGNHASNDAIMAAARTAHIGLTFEPCMEDGSFSGARKGSGVRA